MKRFILSILAVTVFFLGVGSLIERSGARFKSDDKALALVAKARQAIGGDAAIANIQSMRVVGRTTRTFKVDGTDKTSEGETEIAMQLPDKFMKMVKIGDGEIGERQFDVMVTGEPKDHFKVQLDAPAAEQGVHKKIVIKKDDGSEQVLTDADADKWIAEHPGIPGDKQIVIRKMGENGEELPPIPGGGDMLIRRNDGDANVTFTTKDGKTVVGSDQVILRHGEHGERGEAHANDMLRFTLGLLLTAPQGTDVEYTSGGEASLKGTPCNVVVASTGGKVFKLFLDAVSNLPVGMNYSGFKMPSIIKFNLPATAPADTEKGVMTFKRVAPETAEFQVLFSDFRSVNGVQLPFHWEQTAGGGAADETFDVTSYEINPANIAEKFQQQKGMMRMKKPEIQ